MDKLKSVSGYHISPYFSFTSHINKKRISPEPNKYFKNHFPLSDLAGLSQDSSQHLLVRSLLASFTVFSDKMSDYLKIVRRKRIKQEREK